MKTIKRIITALIIFTFLLTICGCNSNKKVVDEAKNMPYDSIPSNNAAPSGVIADNGNYELSWDAEQACILLKDKISDVVWSTIPYDFYLNNKTSGRDVVMMTSPIMLEYVSIKNKSAIKTINGYNGILKNGKIGSEIIKDGVKVTYFFDKLEIAIPVEYTLRDSGLVASIIVDEISESDNLVYKISLAPFLCNSVNSQEKNENYLVIPSGNGALMYTDVRNNGIREYSERVYGEDNSRHLSEKILNTETIRMAFFGAKDGNKAICGIIEEGASCAQIDAIAGDEKIGRSAVYPTFVLRGSDVSAISFGQGNVSEVETISSDKINAKRITVSYCVLNNEDANYSGMSRIYQNYLIKSNKIEKINEKNLTVNILGGLQVKSLFLGIPYYKTVSATTFNEALGIIKEVNSISDLTMDVVLSGFGNTGLDVGEIAGGYKFHSVFGSKKDFINLKDYCDDNKIDLYVDFDIVNFNKSSNGFSKTFHAAKSANSFTAYQSYYSPALRNEDERFEKFVLLNRSKLNNAAVKLFDFADKYEINNIGISTLGNTAYSDYDDKNYYVRGQMEKDVKAIISNAKKDGLNVLISQANDYAAICADKIIDVPTTSSKYDVLDEDIPLYQMTFKGISNISVSSLNTTINSRKSFLKALEGGSGISFTLSANYDTDFATSKHTAFAVSYAPDNIELIKSYSKESKEFYNSIKSAKVKNHFIISSDVRCTEFDNGVKLFVNYSDEAVELTEGKIESMSFIYREG